MTGFYRGNKKEELSKNLYGCGIIFKGKVEFSGQSFSPGHYHLIQKQVIL